MWRRRMSTRRVPSAASRLAQDAEGKRRWTFNESCAVGKHQGDIFFPTPGPIDATTPSDRPTSAREDLAAGFSAVRPRSTTPAPLERRAERHPRRPHEEKVAQRRGREGPANPRGRRPAPQHLRVGVHQTGEKSGALCLFWGGRLSPSRQTACAGGAAGRCRRAGRSAPGARLDRSRTRAFCRSDRPLSGFRENAPKAPRQPEWRSGSRLPDRFQHLPQAVAVSARRWPGNGDDGAVQRR